MKKDTRKIKPRNPLAQSPLLRKGGVHERPKGGRRQQAKQQTRREVSDGEAER